MKQTVFALIFLVCIPVFLFCEDTTISVQTSWPAGQYVFDTITVNDTLICQGNAGLDTGVVIKCYNFIVNTSGKVLADGQGYPGGQGPGKSPGASAGGGYGGNGSGAYNYAGGGPTYGSIKYPSDLGSGGGVGPGGGLIALNVDNELLVNGTISANGPSSAGYEGAGSGGTVFIMTKILSGASTGKITANGGDGLNSARGSGGGGRIAIYYETKTYSGIITTYRGPLAGGFSPTAGSGTIFMKSSGQTNGDFIIDGGGYINNYITLLESIMADTIQMKGSGMLDIQSGKTVSVTTIYSDTSTSKIKATGTLSLPSTYWNSGGFSNVTIIDNGGISIPGSNLIIGGGGILESMINTLALNNCTIKSGGTLTHTANATSKTYWLDCLVNNDMTIEPSGAVNISGRGFISGNGPGTVQSGQGGGSYGGKGISYSGGVTGDTYGSDTWPVDLGSGGSDGYGGGALKLTVWGILKIDGQIVSEGSYPVGNMAGSGGSILILAPNFTGSTSGKISVKGSAPSGGGVGGGGGRMAIYYDVINYLGSYDTAGGPGCTPVHTGTRYMQQTVFHLPPRTVSIDNPAYSGPIPGKRPSFKWSSPTDQENDSAHFQIEIASDSNFNTVVVDVMSATAQTGFRYSSDNGLTWNDFPGYGIPTNGLPAYRISYTCQQDLWVGNWYWRVRAKDIDGYGSWSDTGYLPSIIGDLVVKITSPSAGGSDSVATYNDKINIEGTIEQSISQTVTINGISQNLTVADNKFSIEVSLEYGKTTVVVIGNGAIGNYLSDTVGIYRYRVPLGGSEAKLGKTGGTVRIEDWDADADNDARIEIPDGALDREVTVMMRYAEGDTPVYGSMPVYEIKVDNKDNYKFIKKVKIALNYKNMYVRQQDEDKLRVFHWDGVKWQMVGGEVNKSKKTVSCYTNHTSKYAVMLPAESKDVIVTVAPDVFTPNRDGINDMAIFNCAVKSGGKLEIRIYESTGKIIRVISDDDIGAGISIGWEGLDESGKLVETGIYYYAVVVSGKQVASGTLVVAK